MTLLYFPFEAIALAEEVLEERLTTDFDAYPSHHVADDDLPDD